MEGIDLWYVASPSARRLLNLLDVSRLSRLSVFLRSTILWLATGQACSTVPNPFPSIANTFSRLFNIFTIRDDSCSGWMHVWWSRNPKRGSNRRNLTCCTAVALLAHLFLIDYSFHSSAHSILRNLHVTSSPVLWDESDGIRWYAVSTRI
jgi:hypothetical protein